MYFIITARWDSNSYHSIKILLRTTMITDMGEANNFNVFLEGAVTRVRHKVYIENCRLMFPWHSEH